MLRPDTLALTALLALLTAIGPLSVDLYLPSLPEIGRALAAPPGAVDRGADRRALRAGLRGGRRHRAGARGGARSLRGRARRPRALPHGDDHGACPDRRAADRQPAAGGLRLA